MKNQNTKPTFKQFLKFTGIVLAVAVGYVVAMIYIACSLLAK